MGEVRLGIDIRKVLELRDRFGLTAFIETGTYKMGSTMLAQPFFERIITIEGYRPRFEKNVASLTTPPENVEFWYGDSRTELAKALRQVGRPALLWLDAHWCGNSTHAFAVGDECPLREELEAVLASQYARQHVLMIDDARLFAQGQLGSHNPDQWMTYAEIEQMLAPRRLMIVEDVIYVEPLQGDSQEGTS